jgi:uncharacterized protein YqjF (DUF2071 family)
MKTFLTAEWRKLAIANYEVDPSILKKYIPLKTEIDLWNNTCYVSLVGFMFLNTKVKGLKIPYHTNFEEVNLRFYVKYRANNEWKRGVVFIKEIVPKSVLTFVANTVYKEHYATLAMDYSWKEYADSLEVEYKWKSSVWNSIKVTADLGLTDFIEGSEEDFISEHYWGYTKTSDILTSEYGVEHPKWQFYKVKDYLINVNFGEVYSEEFTFLNNCKPKSVFLAEGSEIKVKEGTKI